MVRLIRFIVLANFFAFALVYGIEYFTNALGIKYVSDYAFFGVVVLWGLAAFLWLNPPMGGATHTIDRAERVTDPMVDRRVADEVDGQRFSENIVLYIKLFISGIPAFVICVALAIAT